MSWPLNFCISVSQNWISALASSVMVKNLHQACLELIRAYRLLVISLTTGLRAKDIEIILPVRLAMPLARIRFLGNAFASWACNTVIFSSGTDTIPKFKVNVKA